MSLTLELPPELESKVRRVAASRGLAPEALAVFALADGLHSGRYADSDLESGILQAISDGLPEAIWARYHALQEKRRKEQISDTEHQELLSLLAQVEAWTARRLELVMQLAQLRGVPFETVFKELELATDPYA